MANFGNEDILWEEVIKVAEVLQNGITTGLSKFYMGKPYIAMLKY